MSIATNATIAAEGKLESEFYHGTLNLVMGNGKSVVVATDSRATKTNQQGQIIGSEDFHQKLFPIAKDIVVTIAGYNSASVIAAPEFTAPAAAIVSEYVAQTKGYNHSPDYREVVNALSFLMNFHLTSVASINQVTGLQVSPGNYLFQMLVVGNYGSKIVATKVVLVSKVVQGKGGNYVESNIQNIFTTEFNDQFIFETAGADSTAIDVLKNPERYVSFPAIKNYMDHLKSDGGRNLTNKELKDIAETIMKISIKANAGIGGPIQVAIFENNSMSTDIPNFPKPKGASIAFNLCINSGFGGGTPFKLGPGVIMLFVSNKFGNVATEIDNQYFFGNIFSNCVLSVNSESFSFDKSNIVQNCELIIGKAVNVNSDKIKELKAIFKWKSIERVDR